MVETPQDGAGSLMRISRQQNKQKAACSLEDVTHLPLRQLLLVHLPDLGAVCQEVAQFHIALPQLLVPAATTGSESLTATLGLPDPQQPFPCSSTLPALNYHILGGLRTVSPHTGCLLGVPSVAELGRPDAEVNDDGEGDDVGVKLLPIQLVDPHRAGFLWQQKQQRKL